MSYLNVMRNIYLKIVELIYLLFHENFGENFGDMILNKSDTSLNSF